MSTVRQVGTKCEVVVGTLRMVVDPALGGRILEFSCRGRNALVTSGPQVGSTFWISPQALWDWPPPAEIDSSLYGVRTDSESVTLTGSVSQMLGVYVTKRFTTDPGIPAVNIEYAIVNAKAVPVNVAPWEVSRVAGGLTFYPSRSRRLAISSLPTMESQGYVWYDYNPLLIGGGGSPKLFDTSRGGWIANVNQGLLFLKIFDNIKAQEAAPGEAEVEVYAHPDVNHPYVEVEQQGPYSTLVPGDRLIWSVQWRLYEVPPDLDVSPGSEMLIQWVESLTFKPTVRTR